MKRWIAMLMSILMLFGLASCASVPESSAPEDACDLAFDLKNYDSFAHIFNEKSLEEWEAMGRYTILLKGLHMPVVVHMDGTDVVSIDAFDRTVELGESGLANEYHDGFSPVYNISSTQKAVVIRVLDGEYSEHSIVVTKDRCHTLKPENGYCTAVFVADDGSLRYCRTWDRMNDFEQMRFAALGSCADRDEPLYETGRIEIVGDDLVLTPEETVVLSEMYDLDALFAEGKTAGAFEEYDSLDAMLAANEG
jgi:hypothetical protein